MRLIFMKNFTQEIKIFSDSNKPGDGFQCSPNKGFSLKGEPNIEKVLEQVEINFGKGKIEEVLLVGNAGILKDIEEHYKQNSKGVHVKWQ